MRTQFSSYFLPTVLARSLVPLFLFCMTSAATSAQDKPRARDLGIPFDGAPGALNAITDVAGVEVGFSTIIKGHGELRVGEGPARTGVTAIFPRGRTYDPVFAGWYTLNGNGEMTGTTWVEESGFLDTPILITNTFSVGVVRDATIAWMAEHEYHSPGNYWYTYPLVAETYDGFLNDIVGQHVTSENAFEALNSAASGPVQEGNVGGGTGMICHSFKCGTGTASRKIPEDRGGYTIGVLVQANYGRRSTFSVAGVPVGKEITDMRPETLSESPEDGAGSIIVIVATDAPLLPHQLKRIARRIPLGIGRMGGQGGNGSGDIFLAFSTANPGAANRRENQRLEMLPNDRIGPLFEATIQATEEAILNAMVAAETLTGQNGHTAYAIPHDRLREAMRKYNRLRE